jgi:histidinol dehydrogenase
VELERIEAAGDPRALAERLRALVPHPHSVSEAVAEIIAQVRAHGDAAVRDYTRRFDTAGAEPPTLVVPQDELAVAGAAVDPHVRSGLERAIENVRRVAEAGLREDRTVELGRHRVIRRERPVRRAAVYVPGGRAPYPSTVVMGAVTARVAGVSEVVVCSPPRADGRLDPAILAACELA